METQDYGKILMVLSIALLVVIVYSASKIVALNQQLHKGCELPENICPFSTSIPIEHAIEFVIGLGIFGIGYKLNSMPKIREPQVSATTLSQTKAKKLAAALPEDEKKVYNIVIGSEGFIFQNELVEKSSMNKVSMTRVLDKLEAKGLVERRRRGMSNVVVLKHN